MRTQAFLLAPFLALSCPIPRGADAAILLPRCPWKELKEQLGRAPAVPHQNVLKRYLKQYQAREADPSVGVELEGVIPKGKSLGKIAEELRLLVATAAGVPPEQVRVEGTSAVFVRNGTTDPILVEKSLRFWRALKKSVQTKNHRRPIVIAPNSRPSSMSPDP